MKINNEKAKEKINDILNKDFNVTPKQLAESYLAEKKLIKNVKQKQGSTSESILGSLFLRRTTLPEVINMYLAEIEKVCKEQNRPIPDGNGQLKTLLSVVLKTDFKFHAARLSKGTSKQLVSNYNTPTIKAILEAIIDFELPVCFSIMANGTMSKLITDANAKNKKNQKVLSNACNILLGGAPLSDHERETIRAIRHRLQSTTYIEMSPLKEVELYKCLYPLSPLPTPENKAGLMEWLRILPKERKVDIESLFYMLQFNYRRKRGCPRDIFFVALQQVIYTLLALENRPEKVKEHGSKKWAQQLSKKIITESYKGLNFLPKLTEKDINNAIHLKNTY